MLDDRTLIDPDGRYPSECLTSIEERAREVMAWRSPCRLERTQNVIEIQFPDPGDSDAVLVALVTNDALELRLSTIEWTCGSHGPALASDLWKRLTWTEVDEVGGVAVPLTALAEAHRERLERCDYCEQLFLPARMSDSACHGCAEKHDGVLF